MQAHEIRQKYLDFFKERGHLQLPSASLIPVDALGNKDTSTLFTGSGMQQFKPYFTGAATPPNGRVTTVQKCVRVKDIDEVGDYSHCTFFEMLGNFSFGDYFKADVIPWTWEFLTSVVGLDADRFCVTVYVDDDEAYSIWRNVIGLPDDRIHRLGEDKNYWPANAISIGPNGPCGPCSEIFYRVAPLEEMTTDPALSPTDRYLLDDKAGRWLEVWNNVFTQFDRGEDADSKALLTPLPKKNNDTGAGFDRIVCVAQGKTSVFDTDLFRPTLEQIERLSGKAYGGSMSPDDFAFRVVAEHTRSMCFCIADGILPGNEGRDYVLRYIMRRAIRYGKTVLGFEEPFLHSVAPYIIAQMGGFYPELVERQQLILNTLHGEEERFRRTLDNGIRILTEMLDSGTVQETHILSGADAFMLYDTYGFPFRLTEELAQERGVRVDDEAFAKAFEDQRERSRQGSNISKDVFGGLSFSADILPATSFKGYDQTVVPTTILAIYGGTQIGDGSPQADDTVSVILEDTPFYAESGGQVGDVGLITAPASEGTDALKIEVTDTKKGLSGYRHIGRIVEGKPVVGQGVQATINVNRRRDTERNHTATHLLQAALRQVLGEHVHQKGSLVNSSGLRFDFTHAQLVTYDELKHVEQIVNAQILADGDVNIYTDIPLDEARSRGAMALFGEKYGDRVRMVEIPDFSLELCGGTHLRHTSQVGLFKITRETGVSSGVRRIEAVTGPGAYEYVNRQEANLGIVANLLKASPADIVVAAERLVAQRQELERLNKQLKAGGAGQSADLAPADIHGIPVVIHRLDNADADAIAALADRTAQKLGRALVVIGGLANGKVSFAAKVSKDLTVQGLHAGNLVREIAKIAGGGGGGRPDFATAGGRDPGKLQDALDAVPRLIEAQLATAAK